MAESVSVVITCHNLERYIGAAIDSVLAQTWRGPIEVLVIDDASTDCSADIIAARPEVRRLHAERNLGVLMATVLGLRAVRGDLVYFLDGDDVWHPDKLARTVPRFEADPALGFLTHDLKYMDGEGRALPQVSRPSLVFQPPRDDEDSRVRAGILMHTKDVWLGSAFAIRRSRVDADAFCAFAETLPDPLGTYQDWPLAYWIACRADVRMDYAPEKLFSYRVHAANYSGSATDAQKALRNARKQLNTMRAMERIAGTRPQSPRVMLETERKARYCRWLVDLYEGRRIAASTGYVRCLPYLLNGPESFIKETVRCAGVLLLGLPRFVALAQRRQAREGAPA
jgi:glycosyltransferase involved in cell wall biosynthesis